MRWLAVFALALLLASCNRWPREKTIAVWNEMRLPAVVLSGTSNMDGYGDFWLIDANGKIVEVQGPGLYLKAGSTIDRASYKP